MASPGGGKAQVMKTIIIINYNIRESVSGVGVVKSQYPQDERVMNGTSVDGWPTRVPVGVPSINIYFASDLAKKSPGGATQSSVTIFRE